MTPAEQIALWADKLRDISAMGLHFAKNIHDEIHFRAVQDIAMEMLALATGEPMERIEPLRAPIFSRPTPVIGVDAAVIDTDGRILLIQRADNGKWAMPGGACEVGDTPVEGAMRETLEETGVYCRPISLVGIFDSRHCGSVTRHHLYHLVFLCAPLDLPVVDPPSHAVEVRGSRWFAEDQLPEDIDPGHKTRIPVAFDVWHGKQQAFFDRQDDL
ncbi:MAG: NUDIX hydrolase N-terminal domain-containing protein [Chloroflexi bacterium]|nr:NUDIX hydrolase N-terminal domain-containing protein [Chloroflexota bacterium]